MSKDDWGETFYEDIDVKSLTALRLVFAFLQIIIGIGAALAGLGPAVEDAIASGGVALFGDATNAAIAAIATQILIYPGMIHVGLEVFRLPMPTFANEDDTCTCISRSPCFLCLTKFEP